ncbi:MAG TPA: type I pullulanase [Kiritimatiellia bacterium]|jgi:pullulanase|nr:type I pullulanase [Lentisphaerota bacterium]HPC19709.1 type I pullulanase [Kiritimatiellia bacterium]
MKRNTSVPGFDSKEFANKFHYAGQDLGARPSRTATSFRVWAPTARSVELLLFRTGHRPETPRVVPMAPGAKGTWTATVKGDLRNRYYRYRLVHPGQAAPVEAVDPYAVATGANGERAMILDLRTTDPAGWARDVKPPFGDPVDAVVYELHVRDFTIHPSAGSRFPGTYLGVAERGTKGPGGVRTGVDHLRELGITHVHLLPVADYGGVDETKSGRSYNWGYNPENYNVPEGSYATDPCDGRVRVREFKRMVQGLHRAGLRVVLDVVYNHTYRGGDSHFHRLVPGYYHRQNAAGGFSNGSGCGNEVASDRSMVRKMMLDSLVYWATEYHVDGFRFDLMGLHDLETMRRIRRAMDRIDPSILLYGEGWTGGDSPLPADRRAMKTNVARLPRVAAFNDTIRDAIKGPVSEHHQGGFVQGAPGFEERLKTGIAASVRHPQIAYPAGDLWNGPWAKQPHHCVSYDSCHDNHALWDKLALTTKGLKNADRLAMNRLAAAIVLTSQGIAFLHAGEEMARSKKGHENTYNLPDSVNAMDWRRKEKYAGLVAYYRGLIALRKAHPAFRLKTATDIRRGLAFLNMPAPGMVGYILQSPAGGNLFAVVFNATARRRTVKLPAAGWRVLVDGRKAGVKTLRRLPGDSCAVVPSSALVLAKT